MPVERTDTRRLLADSLLDLTTGVPFDKVTIADITSNCGVSVRTFYNHFEDKYALMAWVFTESNQRSFDQTIGRGQDFRAYAMACSIAFVQYGTFWQNLARTTHGLYSIIRVIERELFALFSRHLREQMGVCELDPHLAFSLAHYLRLNCETLFEWHASGMEVPLEELSRWVIDDMPPCLRPWLLEEGAK